MGNLKLEDNGRHDFLRSMWLASETQNSNHIEFYLNCLGEKIDVPAAIVR